MKIDTKLNPMDAFKRKSVDMFAVSVYIVFRDMAGKYGWGKNLTVHCILSLCIHVYCNTDQALRLVHYYLSWVANLKEDRLIERYSINSEK